MRRIIFTKHAEERGEERGISRLECLMVLIKGLRYPNLGSNRFKYILRTAQRGIVLIVSPIKNGFRIITAWRE